MEEEEEEEEVSKSQGYRICIQSFSARMLEESPCVYTPDPDGHGLGLGARRGQRGSLGGCRALKGKAMALRRPASIKQLWRAVRGVYRVIACRSTERIDEVLDAGAEPALVDLLMASDQFLQVEAAGVLAMIAAGTSEHVRVVVEHGALPVLIDRVRTSSSDRVRAKAAHALGSIAKFRGLVLRSGGLERGEPPSSLARVSSAQGAVPTSCSPPLTRRFLRMHAVPLGTFPRVQGITGVSCSMKASPAGSSIS